MKFLAIINKPLGDKVSDEVQKMIDQLCTTEQKEADQVIRTLTREKILGMKKNIKLRWFYLAQVNHRELKRGFSDFSELLEPCNEVKIISLIGMTGIGKTTLIQGLLHEMLKKYFQAAPPDEVPYIYVRAPANGDRSMSWTVLYKDILSESHEVLLEQKREVENIDDEKMHYKYGSKTTLGALRKVIDQMLAHRNVRVLVIDEALHLLRFDDYGAIMDTLKSLADSHSTKLVLIGNYDIADLVSSYGQVVRRGEIIHYRRYKVAEEKDVGSNDDQKEFQRVVNKFQSLWPNEIVPDLNSIWRPLMLASLGSVGLLKILLLRLLALQIRSKDQNITGAMLKKASKSPIALQQIERETLLGEEKLIDSCYGDSIFTDASLIEFKTFKADAYNG